MPKRDDLKTILILGSGPIVIGQGCEFDYSGTQACKALREEGYKVVLVNSNPATIMTDPEFSDRTYIEPITPEAVTRIIAKEQHGPYHIDALLPTLGGQTALNCACALFDDGTLAKYGIEMIGATREVIYRAEDRQQFKEIVEGIGLKMAAAGIANTMEEAWQVLEHTGLPAIIRPAFTLGGTGGGIAYNREEFEDIIRRGLDASMNHQVLIDQSLIGWKEYELEVMRDREDNVVIVCSIENIDAMGVHTGDSITVAPAQTLTDKEYQKMRDAAMGIIRAIGVDTGGSNIQFAVDPDTGEQVVIEMNPRVSRSSALASKATGFPIAKIAAKLAVGYTLWELPNDITGQTVACFEPTIDYVVTKIPRWTFEKFPEADETLTTQMKSVGEAMSIGRTFKESLQKGIRSMEVKRFGLGLDANDKWLAWERGQGAKGPRGQGAEKSADAESLASHSAPRPLDPSAPFPEWPIEAGKLRRKLSVPSQGRLYYVRYAFKMGWSIDQVHELTNIDPWFLDQIKQLVDFEDELTAYKALEDLPRELLFRAKQMGYSDAQLANLYLGRINTETILKVRAHRKSLGIKPVYKLVDTCAAEFEAVTPYYYSTYESPYFVDGTEGVSAAAFEKTEVTSPVCYMGELDDDSDPSAPRPLGPSTPVYDDEIRVTDRKKIVILGGGPNRIGQGIEFDYCCVQAAFAAKELGFESVMINSNPETVSTDYDTSDLLFFEPLTLEDVLNICERLNGDRDQGTEGPRDQGTEERGQGVKGPRGQGTEIEKSTDPESPAFHSAPRSLDPSAPSPAVHGLVVSFGGQTPLNLAHGLEAAGMPIIGTSVDAIDLAEDRKRFGDLIMELGIQQPAHGIAYNIEEAIQIANEIGYPVLVRPSFVLGGRAMETVFDEDQLRHYMRIALGASDLENQPILIDDFLADAIECDVDVVADFGTGAAVPRAVICGVMEHIEEAGIHSGDSACATPPFSLPPAVVDAIKEQSRRLAEALQVRGLMNVQWAIQRTDWAEEKGQGAKGPRGQVEEKNADAASPASPSAPSYDIYMLEVNPRASRTVPFVSKATGVPWARIAAKVMAGHQLVDLGVTEEVIPTHTSVKESVFPFGKFPGVDVILGPEMRSTGEVMGADPDFGIAFAKSQMAVGSSLPVQGKIFLSVRDSDKPGVVPIARRFVELGFHVHTTGGTHTYLKEQGVHTTRLMKISEGRPHAADMIKNHELVLLINTPTRKGAGSDEGRLRATALRFNVPMITTLTGAAVAIQAIEALRGGQWQVRALQDYFREQVHSDATTDASAPASRV